MWLSSKFEFAVVSPHLLAEQTRLLVLTRERDHEDTWAPECHLIGTMHQPVLSEKLILS